MAAVRDVIRDVQRKDQHDLAVVLELFAAVSEDRQVTTTGWKDDLPDVKQREPTAWYDVKTLDDDARVAISRRQIERFRELEDVYLALWDTANGSGRRIESLDEALERAERYRGSLWWPGKNGRDEFALIDSSDVLGEFSKPYADRDTAAAPVITGASHIAQLTFDGREVLNVHAGRMGGRQVDVIEVLKYCGGLTSSEVGLTLHMTRGYCPEFQRQDSYTGDYAGGACCRKAVDEGSDLMGRLARQGRVWKDDTFWRLYPERWTA